MALDILSVALRRERVMGFQQLIYTLLDWRMFSLVKVVVVNILFLVLTDLIVLVR